MVYTSKLRLSENSTLVISYDEESSKATITEANSGKTATATLSSGDGKRAVKKEEK